MTETPPEVSQEPISDEKAEETMQEIREAFEQGDKGVTAPPDKRKPILVRPPEAWSAEIKAAAREVGFSQHAWLLSVIRAAKDGETLVIPLEWEDEISAAYGKRGITRAEFLLKAVRRVLDGEKRND